MHRQPGKDTACCVSRVEGKASEKNTFSVEALHHRLPIPDKCHMVTGYTATTRMGPNLGPTAGLLIVHLEDHSKAFGSPRKLRGSMGEAMIMKRMIHGPSKDRRI